MFIINVHTQFHTHTPVYASTIPALVTETTKKPREAALLS